MSEMIKGLSIDIGLNTMNLDAGLKDVKANLKAVAAEQKANMSAFDRGEKSIQKYTVQLEGMNKRLEVQRAVTDKASTSYEKMVQQHGEGSKEAQKAAKTYNEEVAQLNNLQRSVDKVTDEMKEFERQQGIAASGWTQFGNKMEGFGTKMKSVGSSMKDVGQNLTLGITAPLIGIGVAASKTAIDFESQMSRVAGISGATASEMKQLEQAALDLGASTSKSASEVALAQEELAAMGFTVQDILGAMPGVISAAEASGADMAQTAEVMAAALNIFNMEATEATRVADILAQTANVSAADINDMQLALKYAGPPASALGVSLEELSASIGIMTNAGLRGENAGTALRAAMLALLNPSEKNSKMMEKMGIQITDNEGNFLGLSKVVENLSKSMEGQTETQKAANLAALVGTEAVSGMLALMSAGPDEIDKMTASLENSAGASAETAAVMRDNMAGAIDEMTGAFETASIEIGNVLAPMIRDAAGIVQDLTQKFIDMSPEAKKTTLVIAGLAAAAGPLLLIGSSIASGIGGIALTISTLTPMIAGAGGLTAAVTGVGGALLTFATGPVGLTIAAIAGLTAGAIGLGKYLSGDALEEVDVFGEGLKGVSADTTEALDSFWGLSDGVSDVLTEMKATGSVMTEEFGSELVSNFEQMNAQLLAKMNEGYEERRQQLVSSFEGVRYLTDQEQQEVLKRMDTNHQLEVEKQQAQMDRINEIKAVALKEKRELTENEEIEIAAIQTQMQEEAITQLSESAAEEAAIRQRLADTAGEITKNQAADLIKRAAEMRDQTVKEAEKQYDEQVALYTYLRDETGELTAEQAARAIDAAKYERDETVKEAGEKYDEIYNETVSSNKELNNLIDKDTGEKLSKWQVYWNNTKTFFVDGYKKIEETTANWGKNIVLSIVSTIGTMKQKWSEMKTNAVNTFEEMKRDAGKKFGELVLGATQIPGKIKDGINGMKHKAVEGVSAMGRAMLTKLESVVNGLIGGVNTVLSKIGMQSAYLQPIKLNVNKYARGTEGHPGGLAIVGDGTGHLRGRELIQTPSGEYALSPDKPTLVNLPKGTSVLSAPETKNLLGDVPKYAKGIGWLKDAASTVWDYATNPSKLIDKMISGLGLKINGLFGGAMSMATGAFKYISKNAVSFLKGMFQKAGDFTGGKFGPPFRLTSRAGWRINPVTGLRAFHFGDDYGAPAGTRIPSQSSGVVTQSGFHRLRGNYVRVKSGPYQMVYQHNTRNLVRRGQSVSKGQTLGTVGSTGRSTGNHLHFEIWKNGRFIPPVSMGFAKGGIVNKPGVYPLAENGHKEIVIPTEPRYRTNAMKLLAIAGKMIGGKDTSTRPHMLNGGTGGVFEQMLAATMDQNQMLMDQNKLLQAILLKDTDVYLDNRKVGSAISEYLGDRHGMTAAMRGV